MSTDRIWLLLARKFSGEASPEELKELEEGLRSDIGLHFPVHAIEDLWHQKSAGPDEELEKALVRHLERMNGMGIGFDPTENLEDKNPGTVAGQPGRVNRNTMAYLSVAVLSMTIAVGLHYFSRRTADGSASVSPKRSVSKVSTRNGSKTQVYLPDGTMVWLNAGSTLAYDKNFGQTFREVTLSGEGYFDVVKDSSRPFIIHTKHMDIRVLGTLFNVRSYSGDRSSETALIRGSIEVTLKDRPFEKLTLKPNEKLVVSNGVQPVAVEPKSKKKRRAEDPLLRLTHLSYLEQDSTIIETSWVYNKLIFEDESFHDLANRLSRRYGVSFHFHDPEAEDLRFTGVFEKESIREALLALKITGGFNYRIEGNDITITR